MALLSIVLASEINGGNYIEESQALSFEDCGGPSWYLDNISHGHAPSLRSGQIRGVGSSNICLSVKGPIEISFWWMAERPSSIASAFSFLIDGDVKYCCDSKDWTHVSYIIRDNKTHTLKWRFSKFRSYPEYEGVGRIDELIIKPLSREALLKTSDYSDSVINNLILNLTEIRSSQKNIEEDLTEIKTKQIEATSELNLIKREIGNILLENSTVYVSKSCVNPQNYTFDTISKAILHVKPKGTVKIGNGLYNEVLHIEKPLNLIGSDKNNTQIQSNGTIVYVNSSDVHISNCNIKGTKKSEVGILLRFVTNCYINDVNIRNCNKGLSLFLSNNTNIYHNNICDVYTGIQLDTASKNIIKENVIANIDDFGVCLQATSYNLLKIKTYGNIINNNTIINTTDGFRISSYCEKNEFRYNLLGMVKKCDFCLDNEYILENNTIGNFSIDKQYIGPYICLKNLA